MNLSVSKWIKISLLLDESEMAHFLSHLEKTVGPFGFYDVQKITPQGEGIRSSDEFLDSYRSYITYLKKGEVPPFSQFRTLLSPVMSMTEKAFTIEKVDEKRQLIKAILPVIQLQCSQISYSQEDDKFRTQIFGTGGISWGIQVGYPFLYQDPKTYEIQSTRNFPNTPLFHEIQKWIRNKTRSTPFIVQQKKRNEPIRIGKKCFEWISMHPQLKTQGIQIEGML